MITDEAGGMLARCYFRAKGEVDFVFVDMPLETGNEYAGILPASSANTEAIEYLLLAVNNNKVVVRSAIFEVDREEGDTPPVWQKVDSSGRVSVMTELARAPQTIPGFTDSIITDVVESALRFGYVAEGIYTLSQDGWVSASGCSKRRNCCCNEHSHRDYNCSRC